MKVLHVSTAFILCNEFRVHSILPLILWATSQLLLTHHRNIYLYHITLSITPYSILNLIDPHTFCLLITSKLVLFTLSHSTKNLQSSLDLIRFQFNNYISSYYLSVFPRLKRRGERAKRSFKNIFRNIRDF